MEITIVLGLLVLAIVLFATEWLGVDVITILVLLTLVLCGILTPDEAYKGFSSDFILILASIFIMVGALRKTGILENFISHTVNFDIRNSNLLMFIIMMVTAVFSAFMNNTTMTALMINPAIGLSRKAGIHPSRILMPIAFVSIMGGTCTLIGTSTNVAVNGYIKSHGIGSVGMFDFLGIGLLLVGIGILYMMTIGRWLLPDREKADPASDYNVREYLSEVAILEGSSLIGQKIMESELSKLGFRIVNIVRDGYMFEPNQFAEIHRDDILLVRGKVEDLLKVKDTNGVEIKGDLLDFNASKKDLHLGELMVTANSHAVNRTIKELGFVRRYGVTALAVYRKGTTFNTKIGTLPLQAGDLLLVQGNKENFGYIRSSENDFIVIEDFKPQLNLKKKGILTIAFFVAAVILGSLEVIPLSAAFLLGAAATVVFRCIDAREIYNEIDWRLLVLIGGMAAFGVAMTNTGADKFLADYIIYWFSNFGLYGILGGFILLTVLLTQPLSNAAAALIVLPVALNTAAQLHVNPMTFAIAVMLSASISMITPFEPACILVYGPGKYKFFDFVKVGGILTAILMVVLLWIVPVFYPF